MNGDVLGGLLPAKLEPAAAPGPPGFFVFAFIGCGILNSLRHDMFTRICAAEQQAEHSPQKAHRCPFF